MLLKFLQSKLGMDPEKWKRNLTQEEVVFVESLEKEIGEGVKFADNFLQQFLQDKFKIKYYKPNIYFFRDRDVGNMLVVDASRKRQPIAISSLALVLRFSFILKWNERGFKFENLALLFHEYGHVIHRQIKREKDLSGIESERQADFISGVLLAAFLKSKGIVLQSEELENFWLLIGAEVDFDLKDSYKINHNVQKSSKGHALSFERFSYFKSGFELGYINPENTLYQELLNK